MLYKTYRFLIKLLLNTLGILPLWLHHFNARWVGWILEHVVRYRVKLCNENLRHAFPEKSEAERLRIRHQFYFHFSRIFTEALWAGASRGILKKRLGSIINLGDTDAIEQSYTNSPGVMVMSAHNGNWELTAQIVSMLEDRYGYPEESFCVTYRRMSSAVMGDIMKENRLNPLKNPDVFKGYLESKEVLRYVLKHLDSKKIYNFITDQRPYYTLQNARMIKFLNRDCLIMDASAALSAKCSFAVVYQHMFPTSHGYDVSYELITPNASEMPVDEIMDRYYALLEADIKAQPFNYLWTHNRWRIK